MLRQHSAPIIDDMVVESPRRAALEAGDTVLDWFERRTREDIERIDATIGSGASVSRARERALTLANEHLGADWVAAQERQAMGRVEGVLATVLELRAGALEHAWSGRPVGSVGTMILAAWLAALAGEELDEGDREVLRRVARLGGLPA